MNPEDKFGPEGKILKPPRMITLLKHVACPWCGILVLAESGDYIEHVRDCREERGEGD